MILVHYLVFHLQNADYKCQIMVVKTVFNYSSAWKWNVTLQRLSIYRSQPRPQDLIVLSIPWFYLFGISPRIALNVRRPGPSNVSARAATRSSRDNLGHEIVNAIQESRMRSPARQKYRPIYHSHYRLHRQSGIDICELRGQCTRKHPIRRISNPPPRKPNTTRNLQITSKLNSSLFYQRSTKINNFGFRSL